jgi:hypothetical protein
VADLRREWLLRTSKAHYRRALTFQVCFAERNAAFELASGIENQNFMGTEAPMSEASEFLIDQRG